MEAIKFYIPFEGFYYSIYDSLIDNVIESEIEEGYMTEEQSEYISYQPIFEAMSEHIFDKIVELFNDEFQLFTENTYFKYDGLYSPKYYNFETDKIKAICIPEVYLTIYNKFIINDEFVNFVNKASKSRDGFVSFYEGINEVKKEPAIFLEYLFKWFTLNEYRDETIQETCEDLTEIIYKNLEY
jgi:hypothetical protein